MDKLGVTVDEIGIIVLSHIHGDHVGGLLEILNKNSRIEVYVPASFPAGFKSRIKSFGCGMVEVEESLKICNGVMTTGELDRG
jgi:metal-dependent hydrolase (beta-lactamase superfamily II)